MILDKKYRTILSVALPLMGSSFIQSLVLLTDASFLARFKADPLAFGAVGNGGLIFVSMIMLIKGLGDGSQILIARRIGEQKENRNPIIVGTGTLINWIFSFLIICLSFFVLPNLILNFAGNEEIAVRQIDYVQIRSWGTIFGAVNFVGMGYFIAKGQSRTVLFGALTMALVNIVLDWLFIFGVGNFSAAGLKGAAWASVCAELAGMIFYLMALIKSEQNFISKVKIDWKAGKQIIKVSGPIMFQGIVALSTWTVFFFWLEQIGVYELNVSQNIRSIYFIAFIPIFAFGGTTKTYISQYLGDNRQDELREIMRKIQLSTIVVLFVILHGMIFYPEKMISWVNPNEQYIAESADILRYIFGSLMLYGITAIYFYTISGSGNTRFTFYIELAAVILYLIFAYIFIKIWKVDLIWIWTVEYIYFIVLGGLSFWYIRTSNWKEKKI